jgi:adenylate cyclase
MAPARKIQRVVAHYLSRSYREAIRQGEQVISSYPHLHLVYRWLAASQGQLAWFDQARQTLQMAQDINAEAYRNYSRKLAPWMRPSDHAHLIDGLCKAGWRGVSTSST